MLKIEQEHVDAFRQVRELHKAQTVPMYVVVKDDKLATEPDPGSLRLKTAGRRQQQIRSGRRGSVSAERYDPEKDVMLSGSGSCGGNVIGGDKGASGGDGTGAAQGGGRCDVAVHPKTPEQRRRLAEAVRDILLFRSLDAEVMNAVIAAMFERHVAPGDYVIRQGDDGDNFYVIDSGVYDVVITSGTGDDRQSARVLQFDGRGSFGELALMYNQPRAASVIAVTQGQLWAMDRLSFRRLVLQSAFQKRQLYDRMLRGVPMLAALDDYERATLADALQSMTFADGQLIVAEGDQRADGMYFIERGAARVTITKNGRETEVARLDAGSYFGEMALLENSARTASVYAMATTASAAAADARESTTTTAATTADDGKTSTTTVNGEKVDVERAGEKRDERDKNAPTSSGDRVDYDSGGQDLVKVAFLERESFERLLGPCLDVLKRNTAFYQKSGP
jgi:cAMP-dependent protein kinase regulator